MKALKLPLSLVVKSKEQAKSAKINPNNGNFKKIFGNPGAEEFLNSLGFVKNFSSTY